MSSELFAHPSGEMLATLYSSISAATLVENSSVAKHRTELYIDVHVTAFPHGYLVSNDLLCSPHSTMSTESEPPRKRSRTDSVDDGELSAAEPQSAPIRHEKYYFPDGNFIILVEGTLFNVKSMIALHCSPFN